MGLVDTVSAGMGCCSLVLVIVLEAATLWVCTWPKMESGHGGAVWHGWTGTTARRLGGKLLGKMCTTESSYDNEACYELFPLRDLRVGGFSTLTGHPGSSDKDVQKLLYSRYSQVAVLSI